MYNYGLIGGPNINGSLPMGKLTHKQTAVTCYICNKHSAQHEWLAISTPIVLDTTVFRLNFPFTVVNCIPLTRITKKQFKIVFLLLSYYNEFTLSFQQKSPGTELGGKSL